MVVTVDYMWFGVLAVLYGSRPEKSKVQTIPGQLNVTIECMPPDFSSKKRSGVCVHFRDSDEEGVAPLKWATPGSLC
ncbi:hypothetical protein J4Q44_G00378090 [Coregonus suidteri]|uniref:Uncharacterized protein n=1 Tax=Coregonus suidteri TaxID=861788 RepID=A0AAN8Q544_9TELE